MALLTLGKSCGMTPSSFRSWQEMRISLERSELTRASMYVCSGAAASVVTDDGGGEGGGTAALHPVAFLGAVKLNR